MDIATLPASVRPTLSAPGPRDRPGRWIGGLLGGLTSALLAGGAAIAQHVAPGIDASSIVAVGLLGIPVGFILGRAALPSARGHGWIEAIGIGMLVGLAAPPLGALELVLGIGALGGFSGSSGSGTPAIVGGLMLLILAVPFSYIAVAITIPVGIVWAIAARAVPEAWLRRARMPAPLAALGVRHLAAVGAVILLVIAAAQLTAAGPLA